MAEWGKSEDHERWLALQKQAQTVLSRKAKTLLESDWVYYSAMAEAPDITVREREQWVLLRDEAGRRLGKFAPPSEQMELPFDTEPDH